MMYYVLNSIQSCVHLCGRSVLSTRKRVIMVCMAPTGGPPFIESLGNIHVRALILGLALCYVIFVLIINIII